MKVGLKGLAPLSIGKFGRHYSQTTIAEEQIPSQLWLFNLIAALYRRLVQVDPIFGDRSARSSRDMSAIIFLRHTIQDS